MMDFLRDNRTVLPKMFSLAGRILCIAASSSASERVFWCCWSSAGKAPYYGTNLARAPDSVNSLQFLNSNMWHFIVCWQYDTDSSRFWVEILKLGHFNFCILNVLHFDSSPISNIMRFWVKILRLRQLSVCILKKYHLRLRPIKVPTRWSNNIAPRAMLHRLIIHW